MISFWHSPYRTPQQYRELFFLTKNNKIYSGYYEQTGATMVAYRSGNEFFRDDDILRWTYVYKTHLFLKIIIFLLAFPLLIKSLLVLFDAYMNYIRLII